MIKALLKHGADTQGKDNNGKTARDWAYWIDQGGGIGQPHMSVLEIFSRNTQACASCQASIIGSENLVKDLLNKGVDPNIPCDLEYYKVFPLAEAASTWSCSYC